MNINEITKTLKGCSITYLPELPPADKYMAPDNAMIAVPAEKGKFNIYTWYEGKWVYTCSFNKSDFDLKDLKDAYNDLDNAIKKLTKISANTENGEMFLKLSKIANKVLQAKYELADDVLEPFEKTCNAMKDY